MRISDWSSAVCSSDLISRGHGLVADDAVELSRTAPNIIEGQCPSLLQNLLEVRGLGLLDIRTIFGETSVRRKMKLKHVVKLIRSSPEAFERLPVARKSGGSGKSVSVRGALGGGGIL